MYIHGQLLFLGFIVDAHHRTVKDLLKEICRVRGDYRLGLHLPADYKYRYRLCRLIILLHAFYCKCRLDKMLSICSYIHPVLFPPVLLVILQQPQLLTGHIQEQVCVFTGSGSLMSYKQRSLNVWDITTVELMTVEKFKTVLVHSFTLPPCLRSICTWPWTPSCFKSPSSCHRRITFWPLRLKPLGPVVSRLFWWGLLDLLITYCQRPPKLQPILGSLWLPPLFNCYFN